MRNPRHVRRAIRRRFPRFDQRTPVALLVAALAVSSFLGSAAALAAATAAGAMPSTSQGVAIPKGAKSGFVIVGPLLGTSWTSSTADIGISAVVNNSSHGTTDQGLFLYLWATPAGDGIPVISPLLNFSAMAGISLGTLGPGKSITNIQQSDLTLTPPAKGCYYVSLALLNGVTLVDIWPLSFGPASVHGQPSPSGYAIFPFGGADCAQTTPCIDSPTTGCLLSGRFQVTATYYNATDGKAQGQVLSFGGARAESDESVFFYFTDASNFELGVKALDACTLNDQFWVFLGGLTNQGWEVNVLDTHTGNFKTYDNSLNIVTVTTTDTSALSCP
jgi:hypothetical protein